jgi:hypothetical protein
MSEKRPVIITFFGDLYVLGAILLIVPLIPGVSERVGIYPSTLPALLKIPFLSENVMIVLMSILLLVIAYGFFKLKIWAYWLAVSINVFPVVIWIILYIQNGKHSFYGNPISGIISLVFILPTIKYFSREQKKSE